MSAVFSFFNPDLERLEVIKSFTNSEFGDRVWHRCNSLFDSALILDFEVEAFELRRWLTVPQGLHITIIENR